MKQVVKSLVVVGAMLAAGTAAADMDMDFRPFVGVDYLQAWMEGKGTMPNSNVAGQNAFKKSYPGATVYVGTKFMDNLGLELGWDTSSAKTRTSTGAVAANGATIAGSGVTLSNKTKRSGFHVDLVGFMPVDCWELFGSLGYGSVKAKVSNQTATFTGTTPAQQAAFNTAYPLSSKQKGVFRLGVGASYMFTDMFGLRAKLGWESTNNLRLTAANGTKVNLFKNSTTLALGAFVRW
jgi:hypothetical protein